MNLDALSYRSKWKEHYREMGVLCVGLLLVSLLLPSAVTLVLVVSATALVAIGGGLSPWWWLRLLLLPSGFLLVGAVSLCASADLSSAGLRFHWSSEGMATALRVGERSMAAFCSTLLFSASVPFSRQRQLLAALHVPEALLELLGLVYRFLFLLENRRQGMVQSQQLRLGYQGFRDHLHCLAALGASLFSQSMLRAARLEDGLRARGYRGSLATLPLPSQPLSFLGMALALGLPLCIAWAGILWK